MKPSTHIKISKLAIEASGVKTPNGFSRALFAFGSILPDMTWLLITKPHYATRALPYVEAKLDELLKKDRLSPLDIIKFGMTIHYMSDFCCKVHRSGKFDKPIEHVVYEYKLNKRLNQFYSTLKLEKDFLRCGDFIPNNELHSYIHNRVEAYADGECGYEKDIRAAVRLCSSVCSYVFTHFATEPEAQKARIHALPAKIG